MCKLWHHLPRRSKSKFISKSILTKLYLPSTVDKGRGRRDAEQSGECGLTKRMKFEFKRDATNKTERRNTTDGRKTNDQVTNDRQNCCIHFAERRKEKKHIKLIIKGLMQSRNISRRFCYTSNIHKSSTLFS